METLNFDILNIINSNLSYNDIYHLSFINKYFYDMYKTNKKYIKSESLILYNYALKNNMFNIYNDINISFLQNKYEYPKPEHYKFIKFSVINHNSECVTNYINLEVLKIIDKTITEFSFLSCLKKLKKLQLHNTKINNIDFISNLTNLEELDIGYTQITNLEPLKYLINLKKLNLMKLNVNTLNIFKDMRLLEDLNMYGCTFDNNLNYDNIKDLINLKELCLANTITFNFDYLKYLINLTKLGISHTDIKDLEPITYLKKLNILYMMSIYNKLDLKPLLTLNNIKISVDKWHYNYELILCKHSVNNI